MSSIELSMSSGRYYLNASEIYYVDGNVTETLLDKIFPIGSIYITVSSSSPASLFGGQWEQIKDKFLLAAGDNYTAGSSGGEATHTLSISEMPSHSHSFSGVNNGTTVTGSLGAYPAKIYQDCIPNWTGGYINDTGGSQAHNNMPPYLAVYVWQRIASDK